MGPCFAITLGLLGVAQLLLSVCLHHILLNVGKDGRVCLVLHGEFTLTLSHSSQLTRISKHVVQGDLGGQSELVVPDLGVDNGSSPLIERSDDGTLELDGRDNLDSHDGLQDDRLGLVKCLPKGTNGGESESQFGRILDVRSSVL